MSPLLIAALLIGSAACAGAGLFFYEEESHLCWLGYTLAGALSIPVALLAGALFIAGYWPYRLVAAVFRH